ncbi:MAG: hypothetical protein WBO82_06375 [Neisseria sp.]
MKLTLALPSLDFADAGTLPPLSVPALNELLRFGSFQRNACSLATFYGHYLWSGSLLELAKAQVGVSVTQPALLVSPVWQQIGMHNMNVLSGHDIQISADEAQQFCQGLSEFYHEDGWQFYRVRADLWLATLPETPEWQAAPIWNVLGQVDGTIRAEGTGSGVWLQKQTEIQMWLYRHPLNAARAAVGMPAVNGVWLWRDVEGKAITSILGSDNPAAQFYPSVRLDQAYDFAAWLAALDENGHQEADSVMFIDDLAVTQHTADIWAYKSTLEQLEERWFAPILHALKSGELSEFSLATNGEAGGVWTLKSKPQWRFWKKRHAFTGHL